MMMTKTFALSGFCLLAGFIIGLMVWPASAQTSVPCYTLTPNNHPIFQTATRLAQATKTTVPLQDLPSIYSTITPFPTPSQDVFTDTPLLSRYRVQVGAVNIRVQPSTTSLVVGLLTNNQVVTISELQLAGGITWGRLADGRGWVAIRQGRSDLLVQQ